MFHHITLNSNCYNTHTKTIQPFSVRYWINDRKKKGTMICSQWNCQFHISTCNVGGPSKEWFTEWLVQTWSWFLISYKQLVFKFIQKSNVGYFATLRRVVYQPYSAQTDDTSQLSAHWRRKTYPQRIISPLWKILQLVLIGSWTWLVALQLI